MDTLGTILGGIGSLIILICHIIVIVKMFQRGQTGLGILTIILSLCGIGLLITLIYGWVKAGEWNIRNVMIAYTVGVVLDIAGNAMNPAQIRNILGQAQQQAP